MSQTSLPVPHDRERDELRDLPFPALLASTREPVTSPALEPGHPSITSCHADEAGQAGVLVDLLDWLGELCDRIGRYRVFCGTSHSPLDRWNQTVTWLLGLFAIVVVWHLIGGAR